MKRVWAAIREYWSYLLNKLNAIGSVALAYALLNPNAATELLSALPPKLKTPAAITIPALWFLLVQWAKIKALKKAEKAKGSAEK